MSASTAIRSPAEAVDAMLARLGSLGAESVDLADAPGRVLAEPIHADRDSPPADVSAMDGYAIRLADAARGRLPVADRVLPGRPAPAMPTGACVQIMTGAVVPAGADAIVKREDVDEHGDHIAFRDDAKITPGMNIRRRGENERAGAVIVEPGRAIDAPAVAAMASFGVARPVVRRALRVAVIVTGDELLDVSASVVDWQIRDSNGPTVAAMLRPARWVASIETTRVCDDRPTLREAIERRLNGCDVLLMTGGVSAGTHDFVPATLADAGCDIVFHRLAIRPGGPLLGAIGPGGQLVMGLPGNPLSVMCTLRRVGVPLLRRLAGFSAPEPAPPTVAIAEPDGRSLHLWWYRPVKIDAAGRATLAPTRGSGDVVSAARADGVVEIAPGDASAGPWPFYPWSIA